MVSSARKAPSPTVVILGSSSTVDASTPRPIFAPSQRSQTGVNRLEYSGNSSDAGGVQHAFGRPDLPADPAAHRVVAVAQPDAEQPHDHQRSAAA